MISSKECHSSVAFGRLCANVLEKIEIKLHRINQSGAVASIITTNFELPRISKVLPYVIIVLIGASIVYYFTDMFS